jgi:hypothetical protein
VSDATRDDLDQFVRIERGTAGTSHVAKADAESAKSSEHGDHAPPPTPERCTP